MGDDIDIKKPRKRKDAEPGAELEQEFVPVTTPSADPVWLDYRGTAAHAHHGKGCLVVFTPGLTMLTAAECASVRDVKWVAAQRSAGRLADIATLTPAEVADACERSTSVPAMQAFLAAESAKPLIAGPAKRRNQAAVATLTRKLAKRGK